MIKNLHIKSFKGLENVKIEGLSEINAFVGRNNSGKSSILHAIDIAFLALTIKNWNSFQPKLEIKDLINDVGNFEIKITFSDDEEIIVKSSPSFGPTISSEPTDDQKLRSILVLPDGGMGMLRRDVLTPKQIFQHIEGKNFNMVNSLQILYAIKYYADRNQKGFRSADYKSIITEISKYFPEISKLKSDLTEDHIATLTYKEYGKRLDILYSGTGLKHFLDILVKRILSKADILLLDEPEMGLHPDLQRQFLEYLQRLSLNENLQIFIATHSQVLLNYADEMTLYRVLNKAGKRSIVRIQKDAAYTALSDLGIKPSDLFNHDICLMVEGPSEVVFFEFIIRKLYKEKFDNIAIGIIQYGGANIDGIVKGTIDISNIVSSQKYTFWIRDRDSKPNDDPATSAKRLATKFTSLGLNHHIWSKREIEYYYPEVIHVKAQQGNSTKIGHTRRIFNGNQGRKYTSHASQYSVCVPTGKYLKQLLEENIIYKNQLNHEVRNVINKLIRWKKAINGE